MKQNVRLPDHELGFISITALGALLFSKVISPLLAGAVKNTIANIEPHLKSVVRFVSNKVNDWIDYYVPSDNCALITVPYFFDTFVLEDEESYEYS